MPKLKLVPLSVIVIDNAFAFVFFLLDAFYVNIGPIRTYQQHIIPQPYLFDGGHVIIALREGPKKLMCKGRG